MERWATAEADRVIHKQYSKRKSAKIVCLLALCLFSDNFYATNNVLACLVLVGNWLHGNCRGTSFQCLCCSAQRIRWDLTANAKAEPRPRPIETVRLCWTNSVPCGSSIRLSQSHKE